MLHRDEMIDYFKVVEVIRGGNAGKVIEIKTGCIFQEPGHLKERVGGDNEFSLT